MRSLSFVSLIIGSYCVTFGSAEGFFGYSSLKPELICTKFRILVPGKNGLSHLKNVKEIAPVIVVIGTKMCFFCDQ